MNNPMREQLLGYLIGALDETEREQVEQYLNDSPLWRQELESLQECLEPLAATYEEYEPPDGLVERTCEFVLRHGGPWKVTRAPAASAPMALPIAPPSSRWSMADVVVLAGVCLVAAVLFFPVIVNSRYASQIAVCQNNLRQLGSGLTGYSEDFGDGLFPGVPLSGRRSFAGIYAPILLEAGYITDPRVVVCPAIVEQVALRGFRIPSLAEIDGADDRSIGAMRERAGADYYAYNLGVVIGGQYRAPRNQQRPYFAMMADMPASYLDPQPSRNHGERGFNILFEDGHVAYVTTTDWPARTDDPLRNRQGLPEAGLDENDAVIGRSSSPPFRFVASRTPGSP